MRIERFATGSATSEPGRLAVWGEHLTKVAGLWSSTFAGAGLALLVQVVLARQLSKGDFGVFAALLSAASLMVPLAHLGVPQLWVQLNGSDPIGARLWVKPLVRILIVAASVLVAISICVALAASAALTVSIVVAAVTLHVLGQAANEIVASKYQSELRYKALATSHAAPHVLRALVVIPASIFAANAYAVAAGYALVGAALIVRLVAILRQGAADSVANAVSVEAPATAVAFRRAAVYGLAALFHLLYFQSATVLLGLLKGETVAATFATAFLVISSIYLIPSVLYQKYLMPKIQYWIAHDPDAVARAYKLGGFSMLVAGCFTAVLVACAAGPLISRLFGPEYTESARLLRIMSFALPLMFVCHSAGSLLVGERHVGKKALIMGSVALANVALTVPFIHLFAAEGAAIAVVISSLALAALYNVQAYRLVQTKAGASE